MSYTSPQDGWGMVIWTVSAFLTDDAQFCLRFVTMEAGYERCDRNWGPKRNYKAAEEGEG